MKSKRAQFFGIYLVFLTLMLCGIVVGLFYIQQGNASSSLVSPKAVLDVRDNLSIFEMREMDLINESLVEANKSFGFCDNGFVERFSDVFIGGILVDTEMQDFIFVDLILGGISAEDDARLRSNDFFRNILYSEGLGDCVNDVRGFGRASVGKFVRLTGSGRKEKINFPVDFSFEFERDYLISEVGGKFEVTKV